MSETMLAIGGGIILAWGCLEVFLALRPDMPRHQVAQGTFFIELGSLFLVMALMPPGIMRDSLAVVFGISAAVSLVIQAKLRWKERREQQAQ